MLLLEEFVFKAGDYTPRPPAYQTVIWTIGCLIIVIMSDWASLLFYMRLIRLSVWAHFFLFFLFIYLFFVGTAHSNSV